VVRNDPSDVNTESGTLTVSVVAAACTHSECLPGAALVDGCSACVTEVCDSNPDCCSSGWDGTCATLADAAESCSCGVPSLTSLDTQQLTAGVAATITVTMANAPSAYYQLVLTPSGDGQEQTFDCNAIADNSCEANVTVQTAGNYNAAIRVGQSPNSYDTNVLQQALTVNAASSSNGSSCIASDNQIALSAGTGTCNDPYLVDLSGLTAGGTAWVEIPSTNLNDETNVAVQDVCLEDTQRDIVLEVNLPTSMVLLITAEGDQGDGDPLVSVKPDNVCSEPALSCQNSATAGECIQYREEVSPPGNRAVDVIVSEPFNTNNALIVTFSITT
jgi:hypothetical protein